MNACYNALSRTQTLVPAHLRLPMAYRAALCIQSWSQRLAVVAGACEANTVEFLSRLAGCAKQPGHLLDVGANVGLHSNAPALDVMLRSVGNPKHLPSLAVIKSGLRTPPAG